MQILKENIKHQIVSAATAEFIENGYRDASMKVIAKNANISTSNIYNYFKNKEEIFYMITSPVYHALNAVIERVFNYKDKQNFDDKMFVKRFSELVTQSVFEFIKQYRKELILIMDCSKGTRYENFKTEVINIFETNFTANIKHNKPKESIILEDSFLMHILAINLIDGLLEICREYKSNKWTEVNIDLLIKYHIRGMVQVFA